MKTLYANGTNYENITILDDDTLLKKTSLPKKEWEAIKKLDFHFVVNPIKIMENTITMPYLRDYVSLSENKKTITELKIYQLLLKQMSYIQELEKNGIIHCDIHPNNILLSKTSTDMKLIDFDYSIVGDYISPESIYLEEGLSPELIKLESLQMDKRDCLGIFFTYLAEGKFFDSLDYSDLSKCNIDKSIKTKINDIINYESEIEKEDFLKDELNYLIRTRC